MNCKQCAKALMSHDNILLVTHKNPDGDTVASASALCSSLRRAGRNACLWPNTEISEKLHPYAFAYFAPADYSAAYVVSVDVASEGMLPKGFDGHIDLRIDHHLSESEFSDESCVRSDRSSCGEIVLEVMQNFDQEITAEEATMLYIAVSTDTGCFQYGNTNSATFKAASELLRLGAENGKVNQQFFRKVSRARLALESMIYAGLEYYRDGKISLVTVTKKMMEDAGAGEDDCDDIAGLAGRVEGSMLNITIREIEDSRCKISLRSVPEVSSSDIAAVFGGGGHSMAAGCTISGDPEKAKAILLEVIDEVWK